MSNKFFAAVAVATLLSMSSAEAGGPAVSTSNGKVEAGYAWSGGLGTPYLAGSYDIPIGEHFGFQAEAIGGHLNGGANYGALGGQFFWRDPEMALFGIGAARFKYSNFLTVDHLQVGGEFYFGDFTVTAQADRDFVKAFGFSLGHFDSQQASVGWYPNDNLLLQIGGTFERSGTTATLHAEWQQDFVWHGLSLFADASRDPSRQNSFVVGARFYFGGDDDKTLKRRHREDDPSLMGVLRSLPSNPFEEVLEGFMARYGIEAQVGNPYLAYALEEDRRGLLRTRVDKCRSGYMDVLRQEPIKVTPFNFAVSFAVCDAVAPEKMGNLCQMFYDPNVRTDLTDAERICGPYLTPE